MSTEERNPNLNYVLLDGSPEVRRLSGQHIFMKAVVDLPSFLPSVVNVNKLHRVLDAAAGTTAWLLDLADQPYAESLELYACDITMSKFPPAHILDAAKISAFQHDLTKPLPDKMKGTFDLVHMTYLVYALNGDQWKLVLKNMYDALAPGGYLYLQDSDPVVYPSEDALPPTGGKHDLDACMDGPTVFHEINSVFTGFALKNGFVVGLSYLMTCFLSEAQFSVLERIPVLVPTGALSETRKGLRGHSLVEFKNDILTNFDGIFDQITKHCLAKGILEAPRGVKIKNEDARQALLGRFHRAFVQGILFVNCVWVAQK